MLVHPNMKMCCHLLTLMLFQTCMTLYFDHFLSIQCCLIHGVLQNSLCSAEKRNKFITVIIRVNK